jgi:iduronate 2-sulfatase
MALNSNIGRISLISVFVLHAFTSTLIYSQVKKPNINPTKGIEAPLNVLFIAIDDLRPNIGVYGDSIAITPNLNKLANEGTKFNRAYCQVAVCSPSRASLLTGLYPDQIGVTDLVTNFRIKRPDVVTLPQIFKNNGYQSVIIGKIFHGSKMHQDDVSLTKPPILSFAVRKEQYVLAKNRTGEKATSTEVSMVSDSAYWDGKIANEAIKELKRFKESGDPFFLSVGFMKPHLPFSAPKKYWDMYNRNTVVQLKNRDRPIGAPEIAFHNSNELRGYTDIGNAEISKEKEKELWHGYYASITYVDYQLGKVLDALDRLGLKENTLIVLWGDHGYHLGEQSLWCKSTNYELAARVPLIICNPKMAKGKQINEIVELVDLYPTIIDMCNIQNEKPLSGGSLVNIMKGNNQKWTNLAFNQFGRPYSAAIGGGDLKHMGYSVRSDKFRLTLWFNQISGEIDEREFYEMSEGIEKINISGRSEYNEIENHLTEILIGYKNQNYIKKIKL